MSLKIAEQKSNFSYVVQRSVYMTVSNCLLGMHDWLAGTLALLATLSPSAPVLNHTCTALTYPTDEALCLAVPFTITKLFLPSLRMM